MAEGYGAWLQRLRESKGLTQGELAQKIGRSPSFVQKHEASEEPYGHPSSRRRLAEAFGMAFEDFEEQAAEASGKVLMAVPTSTYSLLQGLASWLGVDEAEALRAGLEALDALGLYGEPKTQKVLGDRFQNEPELARATGSIFKSVRIHAAIIDLDTPPMSVKPSRVSRRSGGRKAGDEKSGGH